jgi:2'-5' RNA ligase
MTPVGGTGVFPRLSNPKVLWLGLENLRLLMPAYIRLGELLRQNGFPFDNKPLKPHLTLARIKSIAHNDSFELFLTQNSRLTFGSVAISRIVLYESISTPGGPVYKPLFVKLLETGRDETT